MSQECICCSSQNWKIKTSLPKFLFGKKAVIEVCQQCGMGRTIPAPYLSPNHYQNNERYDELFVSNALQYRMFAKGLLSMLDGRMEKGRLLDVGCGGGFLVAEALEQGFDAQGIEANEGMVKWAKEQGVPVSTCNLEDKKAKHEKYDVIVFSAVLEHLEHPREILHICTELLKENGVILISQASFDGLLPKVFPWGWYGWQPVEHYWHFTPESFEKLAESCNMEMVSCRRNSLYHKYYLSGGMKTIIARNLATFLAKLGEKKGMGDNFDCLISKRNRLS